MKKKTKKQKPESKTHSNLGHHTLVCQLIMITLMFIMCLTPETSEGRASLSPIEKKEIEEDFVKSPEYSEAEVINMHIDDGDNSKFLTICDPLVQPLKRFWQSEEFQKNLRNLYDQYDRMSVTRQQFINEKMQLHHMMNASKMVVCSTSSVDWDNMTQSEKNQWVKDHCPLISSKWPHDYVYWMLGFTTSRLNVRQSPSTKSKKIAVLDWNTPIKYKQFNDKWAVVENEDYKNKRGFVSLEYIANDKVDSYVKETVYENQKSWMDYRKITDTSSPQYALEQDEAYTGDYGIRMIDGRYLCAVGSYYTKDIGRYIDLILEDGTVIPCILGDQKDDNDTDESNMYTEHDNSVVEFVVDLDEVPAKVKTSGSFGSIKKWNSSIREIRIYYYNPYKEF